MIKDNIIVKVTRGKYAGTLGKIIIQSTNSKKQCVLKVETTQELIIVSEEDLEPI